MGNFRVEFLGKKCLHAVLKTLALKMFSYWDEKVGWLVWKVGQVVEESKNWLLRVSWFIRKLTLHRLPYTSERVFPQRWIAQPRSTELRSKLVGGTFCIPETSIFAPNPSRSISPNPKWEPSLTMLHKVCPSSPNSKWGASLTMMHMGCKDAVNICLRRTAADMSGCAFRHDSVSDIKTISTSKKWSRSGRMCCQYLAEEGERISVAVHLETWYLTQPQNQTIFSQTQLKRNCRWSRSFAKKRTVLFARP